MNSKPVSGEEILVDEFSFEFLETKDGTWDSFKSDWESQCVEVEEDFSDFMPQALAVLSDIASKKTPSTALSTSAVIGIRHLTTGKFWAVAMLNRVIGLPSVAEPVLRVRHLIVSPLLDYGEAPMQAYPDVLVGAVSGILQISESIMSARLIHIHLRSPEDVLFFRALGGGLAMSPQFDKIEAKGAWLYVEKAS
jgi:hypothetical protein